MLALYSGTFIGEIRLKPYLNALLGRGVIAGYQIADRVMSMEGQSGPYAFTHIWCQRNVSTAQFAFLKAHSHAPIIYDMDDLLTSIPDFVASSKRTMMKRIDWCLQQAKAVTVATDKLRDYLREDAPAVGDKVVVLKNGCAQSDPPERRADARQLVWTSSDVPFFMRENPQFASALAALLNTPWLRGGPDRTLRRRACASCSSGRGTSATSISRPIASICARSQAPSPSRRCRRGCRHRRNAISMRNRT